MSVFGDIEAWARVTGRRLGDMLNPANEPGWFAAVPTTQDSTRARVDEGISVALLRKDRTWSHWFLDPVSAHLWALAVEVGDVVDVGPCSTCRGSRIEETFFTIDELCDDAEMARHELAGGWEFDCDGTNEHDEDGAYYWRSCPACDAGGGPTGRDFRALPLLVCQANENARDVPEGDEQLRAILRVNVACGALGDWAESQAELRTVVADARRDWRMTPDPQLEQPHRYIVKGVWWSLSAPDHAQLSRSTALENLRSEVCASQSIRRASSLSASAFSARARQTEDVSERMSNLALSRANSASRASMCAITSA